jgi:S-DNA-T family DNA segregation ATPase FtsK/SpoIIIE
MLGLEPSDAARGTRRHDAGSLPKLPAVKKRKDKAAPPPPAKSRLDGIAWVLLSVGMIVGLTILGQEPNGGNLLGPPGAWLARELVDALGIAVYTLLSAWFVVVLLLLLRQSWLRWSQRLVGWLLLLPSTAGLADWFGPERLSGPIAGPGGTLGALVHATLLDRFDRFECALALGVLSLVGVLMALDFAVFPAVQWTWHACETCGLALSRVLRYLTTKRPPEAAKPIPAPKTPEPIIEIKTPAIDPNAIPINHSGVKPVEIPPPEPTPAAVAPALAAPIAVSAPAPAPEAEDVHRFDNFELPPLTILGDTEPFPYEEQDVRLREQAAFLEKTFQDFDLNVKVVGINTGPVITQFEIMLETGMRVNKVTSLGDDLALHLKVPSVRIVAPIPGKNTVGIEVPNEKRATVRLKELIVGARPKLAKAKLPLFLGKDTEGRPLVFDLAEMPHLLIAGTTGTGKSVCLNAIITSMLMTRRPDEVKMIMIDPKMTEMTEYGRIPHMMHPVVTDMKKAEAILAWAVNKMEERYDVLSRCRVRHISAYNELGLEEIKNRLKPANDDDAKAIQAKMPYIVIVVDELADLMMTMKREVETHIIRLAQKSRAAGIHLVLATQKPTVDVITGLIKSNLPGRIAFKVASRSDSRVVLDEMGADKLLGKGDMLFLQPGTSTLVRAQGTFVADTEITDIVGHLETDEPCYAAELVDLKPSGEEDEDTVERIRRRDPVYEQAVEIVIREGRGSVSLLQRALGIGYGRAARLVDFMAEDGIVGDYKGANAREVLYTIEDWRQLREAAAEHAA